MVTLSVLAVSAVVAIGWAEDADAGIAGSIDAAKQKEQGLASEVAQMNGQIAGIRKDVIRLQGQESIAEAKLVRIQARLAIEQQRLEAAKRELEAAIDELEKRIVEMYKTGKIDVISVLVKSKNWRDFLTRKEFLDRLTDADAALVGKVKRLKARVEASMAHFELLESQVTAARNQLREARVGLEESSASLVIARSARQSALSSVRGQISSLEAKQQAQIAAVAQPAQAGAPGAPISSGFGSGGPSFNGMLNGTITGRPGDARPGHTHMGYDISAPSGTAIKAPSGCTINYVGEMQGYGTTVRGSCGLFAHLNGTNVRAGQKISKGTKVGSVGCSGSCSGPHLHYETSDRFG